LAAAAEAVVLPFEAADTVLRAREAGVPVHVVWPEGAARQTG
jgi:hypothetical protein